MSGAGSRAQSAAGGAKAKGDKAKKSKKDAAPKPPVDELDAMNTEQLAEVWRLEQARLQEARRNRNYYQLEAVSLGADGRGWPGGMQWAQWAQCATPHSSDMRAGRRQLRRQSIHRARNSYRLALPSFRPV